MKISLCITLLNEEKNIVKLLESIINQTKKLDEIVIVDGGSKDNTVDVVKHFQKKYHFIKLIVEKGNIAHGRNIAIELSSSEIIVMTDAGCTANNNWLERITSYFEYESIGVVAGFYKMIAFSPKNKVINCYLGVHPKRFDTRTFLPSTRSVAFRKSVWEKVGRFNEKLTMTGEDTEFFYNCVKKGVKIVRDKGARVDWFENSNLTIKEFFKKISNYSMGDIETGIWWHPIKHLTSHNIKILLILFRYIFVLALLIYSLYTTSLFILVLFLIFLYHFYSIFKWRDILKKRSEVVWIPLVQIVCDIAIIHGFIRGISKKLGVPKTFK